MVLLTAGLYFGLMLLVGQQEGHPARKKIWGKWRWALVSPDEVAPSWMVGMSASVNLSLHHKVQKFCSGTGSPGWSRKKGCKTLVVVVWFNVYFSRVLLFLSWEVTQREPSCFSACS